PNTLAQLELVRVHRQSEWDGGARRVAELPRRVDDPALEAALAPQSDDGVIEREVRLMKRAEVQRVERPARLRQGGLDRRATDERNERFANRRSIHLEPVFPVRLFPYGRRRMP